MTDQTTGRRLIAAVAVAAVTVTLSMALGASAAPADAAPEAGPAATAPQVDDGKSTTLVVTLPEAPDGLSGYELTLVVDEGRVAGASYPDDYQPTTEPAVGPDGQSVTLKAADVSNRITPGASDVRLATVTVEGEGEAPSVRITDASVDADGGDRIDPDAVAVSVEGAIGDGPSLRTDADDSVASETGTSEDVETGEETTGADGPGFGLVTTALALVVIALLARRD